MTSFVHMHQQNHRIQLMMSTVAIVWATMRALLIVMVRSFSWLLVACWSSVFGGQKKEAGDGCGRRGSWIACYVMWQEDRIQGETMAKTSSRSAVILEVLP